MLASSLYTVEMFGKLVCFTSYSTGFIAAFEFDPIQLKWRNCSTEFSESVLKSIQECFKETGAMCYCEESSTLFVLCNNNTYAYKITCDIGDFSVSATQCWRYPMNSSLASFATVTLDKDLYVIGGEERLSVRDVTQVNDVLRCNVQCHEWTQVTPLLEPRASFDAVNFGSISVFLFCFNTKACPCFQCPSFQRLIICLEAWLWMALNDDVKVPINFLVTYFVNLSKSIFKLYKTVWRKDNWFFEDGKHIIGNIFLFSYCYNFNEIQ